VLSNGGGRKGSSKKEKREISLPLYKKRAVTFLVKREEGSLYSLEV